MFLFLYLTLLIAKKTNTSVVVIGCREKHNIYKSFDMHFNLDNKEYSLTLENREKKTKKQKSGLRYALPATALFATQLDYLRVLVCWSEAKHLYQDKHTFNSQIILKYFLCFFKFL